MVRYFGVNNFNTPIVFIIYNRPASTSIVFNRIAQRRPSKYFIVADGPRDNNDGIKCHQARNIATNVNWDCDVHYLFSDINLGCRKRVSTGLNSVFEIVEEAIILEDDTVPDFSFFEYSDVLLTRYRTENVIKMIGGSNPLVKDRRNEVSYKYSKYALIWGWATWKRAWLEYDVNMEDWPLFRDSNSFDSLHQPAERMFWVYYFNKVYNGYDTWAYQWMHSIWANKGKTVLPTNNLITNIGFGSDATHTTITSESELLSVPSEPMQFPLKAPLEKHIDIRRDREIYNKIFGGRINKYSL